jgi:hypothetical protein
MRPHELEKGRERNLIKKQKRQPIIRQCTDCGAAFNARSVVKRCAGCLFLRSKGGDIPQWVRLSKIGKPINCSKCGAPVIMFHPARHLCDECYRNERNLRCQQRFEELSNDPAWMGRQRALANVNRQIFREVMRDSTQLELAVMKELEKLGKETT